MRFEITGQHLIVNSNAHHATFDLRLHGVTSHAEYVRAAIVLHGHMNALNGNLLAAHEPDNPPEPTGPVMLETSEAHTLRGLESLVGARLTRDEADAKIRDVRAHPDPEVSKAVEDYISRVIETRVVFAKPSEPAKPQEVVVESESPKPSVEMPEPTGPVILESSAVAAEMHETDKAVQESLAANPEDIGRLEEILRVRREGLFVKPSEPAEPQEVVCETPSIILAKESQVEDAKSIIQSEGSDTVAEVVTTPEEPEPTEKDKLATAFELDCFEKVTSPETAAKLWEEYKERVSAYGDAYRKMRATSLVMAVVDHNEGLTVPEAGALIQAEIKKLNATPVAKTPEVEQTEKPAEDISTLVQKFVDACKEFEGKPNVSESEIFRLLAVTCATPLPDRKVNPTKAFAVLDGATTLHKVPLLVKAFPDMEAAKEKILGDASKTKKFSMMCAAAKIQIER